MNAANPTANLYTLVVILPRCIGRQRADLNILLTFAHIAEKIGTFQLLHQCLWNCIIHLLFNNRWKSISWQYFKTYHFTSTHLHTATWKLHNVLFIANLVITKHSSLCKYTPFEIEYELSTFGTYPFHKAQVMADKVMLCDQ